MFVRDIIATSLVSLTVTVGMSACQACSSPQQKAIAAESSFFAQQLECVDKASTKAEADACRKAVHEKWGVAETAVDAGKDGAK